MRTTTLSLLILSAGAIAAVHVGSAKAQDASWGCQVVLCAAASNPSWASIPYCVPPMTKLIKAMALPGFSWPICLEAGTGAPGREDYDDCPAGWTVGYTVSVGNNEQRLPNMCERPKTKPINCSGRDIAEGTNGCGGPQDLLERIPRPERADPYYFDIKSSDGPTQRVWFNLNY